MGVVLDPRYAADLSLSIDQIANDLIAAAIAAGRRNYVIVAAGGPETAVVLRTKTQNLPDPKPAIVFTTVTNPGPNSPANLGGLGLVNSFPPLFAGAGGTNLTGMAGQTSERDADRLEILFRILFPSSRPPPTPQDNIGVLVSERRIKKNSQFDDLKPRATQLGLNPQQQLKRSPHDANDIGGIGQAFTFFKHHANLKGVVVMADSLFNNLRGPLIDIANGKPPHGPPAIPAIYQWKEFVVAGGLVSFGPPMTEAYRMAGVYATQILAGTGPESMRVSRPAQSTFEVWMNTITAQLFPHITIPQSVRAGGIDYRVNTFP